MAKEVGYVEERIKIYAVNKKYKEKPFLVTAVTDPIKKVYVTGQEHLSKTDLSNSELVISHKENYMVRNGDELILRKKNEKYELSRDYALYCLLRVVPEIANSKDEVINGSHLFYMQNFEQEAEKKISTSKVRAQAYAKVANFVSLTDMADMLFYFGETAANASHKRAEAKIYELVEAKPAEVIEYFDKSEMSTKIVFIKKLLYYNIVKKQTNGYLIYGDVVLGANENEAAVFVFDVKNDKVYVPLKDQLNKATALK